MKNKLNKPYFYFWITAIFIVLFAAFDKNHDSTFDLNIHDTYYVMEHFAFAQILSGFLSLLGLSYWMFERFGISVNKILTHIHCSTTIIPIWLYWIIMLYFQNLNTTFGNPVTAITLLMIVVSQIFFILNVLLSIYKKIASR